MLNIDYHYLSLIAPMGRFKAYVAHSRAKRNSDIVDTYGEV